MAAGGTLGFKAGQAVFHPGPINFYMAKAPSGTSAASFSGEGNVWFKTYGAKPNGQLSSWPSDSMLNLSRYYPNMLLYSPL
jgi:hypothetical protein